MSRVVDNLLAFRILYMLVTAFEDTQAYKLGIIDKEGNNLIKSSDFTTSEQKDAYTYLHRLVFKLKKLLNKLPGGESKLKNIVAALWLIKENYESKSRSLAFLDEQYTDLLKTLENVTLVEEEIFVSDFFEMLSEDGAPTNAVGNGTKVGLDQPFRKKRKMQAFTVNDDIFRRFKNGKSKYRQWNEYLNLEDDGQKAIYDYARKNPKAIIVLKNGTEMKAIRFNRTGGGSWSKLNRPNKQINNEVV